MLKKIYKSDYEIGIYTFKGGKKINLLLFCSSKFLPICRNFLIILIDISIGQRTITSYVKTNSKQI